jgi:hypothetical protein
MTVRVRIDCELTLPTKITIVEMAKLSCRVRRVRITVTAHASEMDNGTNIKTNISPSLKEAACLE